MTYFGLVFVLLLAGAAAVVAGRNMREGAQGRLKADPQNVALLAADRAGTALQFGAVGICVLLFVVFTMRASLHSVDAGYVGVVYTFGAITTQTDAGLVTTLPWQNLRQASIQVQKYTDQNVQAASKETQNLAASITLNYQVSPVAIQKLYTNVGPNYQDVLIPSRVNNFFKEEAVKYASVDVLPHREDIRIAVREKLSKELDPYSITVNDLLIDNIHFDDAFTKAIEEKQVATQNAQAEANKVAISEAQAKQKAATAQGDADALRINAQGQADANNLLNASLTPQLIQFQAVQKLAPNVQIALIPSGQGLILDPSTLFAPLPGRAATPAAPAR